MARWMGVANLGHWLVRELLELRGLLLELTLRRELDLLGFACLLQTFELFLQDRKYMSSQ